MEKAQIVSMDFIVAFVVFMLALSFYFITMEKTATYDNINLEAPGELIFNRIDQIYDVNYDFLDGSKIDSYKLDKYISDYTPGKTYDFLFKDFENPSFFRRMDYCVYIENMSSQGDVVLKNFAGYPKEDINSSISIGDDECGSSYLNPNKQYVNQLPRCNSGEEALSLTKPVLYNKEIMNLRVLICAQRR